MNPAAAVLSEASASREGAKEESDS